MNVLILDDNRHKSGLIQRALLDVFTCEEISIYFSTCVMSGLTRLREQNFDLLILDLVLPIRKNRLPSSGGGKAILDEIVDGNIRIPSHIICVTAFEDESEILKDDVRRNLVHLVLYDELTMTWKDGLQSKAQLIYKRLLQASVKTSTEYQTDIVIITSSPLVELQEVKKLPGGFIGEFNQTDRIHYYRADWTCIDRIERSVVACAAPSMGMTAACVTACKAVERWKPRFLVMTGIAASTVADQRLGDVLCVETAYDYGSGKIEEDENGKRVFTPSPQQIQLDPKLQSIVKHLEREQIGMSEIQAGWKDGTDAPPKLVVGIMASGAAVVQSREMVETIKSSSRKTVGLDMEAYAIFQTCTLASSPCPKAFVVKSISDYATPSKNDDAQRYAAYTSAKFVHHLFTTVIDVWR